MRIFDPRKFPCVDSPSWNVAAGSQAFITTLEWQQRQERKLDEIQSTQHTSYFLSIMGSRDTKFNHVLLKKQTKKAPSTLLSPKSYENILSFVFFFFNSSFTLVSDLKCIWGVMHDILVHSQAPGIESGEIQRNGLRPRRRSLLEVEQMEQFLCTPTMMSPCTLSMTASLTSWQHSFESRYLLDFLLGSLHPWQDLLNHLKTIVAQITTIDRNLRITMSLGFL